MANDCLVTKLKGVVNNDNLPHLGYMQVKCSFTNTFPNALPKILTYGAGKIRIIGDYTFTDTGLKERDLVEDPNEGTNVYTCDPSVLPYGNYILEVPKYNLYSFKLQGDRGGMTSINHTSVMAFDIEDFAYYRKLNVDIAYQNVYGNIHKLVTGMDELICDIIRLNDSLVEGTLEDCFLLARDLINDSSWRKRDRIDVYLEGTIPGVSGKVSDAINAVKDIVKAGFVIGVKLEDGTNITLDVEGFLAGGATNIITFDGSGGYVITQ